MKILDKTMFEPDIQNRAAAEELVIAPVSFWKGAFQYLKKSKTAVICIVLLFLITAAAIVIPILSPFSYADQNVAFGNKGFLSVDPSNGMRHWFGTDELGRDIFVRLWYGARISLIVGISVAFIDGVLGVLYGGISGYLGGKADTVMMRIVEIINGIPYMLVVVLLMAVLPRGLGTILIAYSITGWTSTARLVRGQVVSLNHQEYMIAAKAMGAGTMRMITRHIVPNIANLIIINITLDIPSVIFTEAFLSLLGLGIAPPQSSLGTMVSKGIQVFQTHASQLLIPAVLICVLTFCFNLLGDELQKALDPKSRR